MPSSCRKGACNTCEAGLLDGEVEQRGRGRRTARDGTALMCRAQPRADLVIRPKRFERIDIFRRKIITARIFRLARPASDVTIVNLRFPIGLRAPFKAGQNLQVIMADGDRRNFSMANAARHNDGAELHIRHVAGGKFSVETLSKLAVGRRPAGRNSLWRFLPACDRPARDPACQRHRLCADQIHHRDGDPCRQSPADASLLGRAPTRGHLSRRSARAVGRSACPGFPSRPCCPNHRRPGAAAAASFTTPSARTAPVSRTPTSMPAAIR